MIELNAGDYRLVLAPRSGGSIARLDWRGLPLLRPARGRAILDSACFPLVPFSNRIAHGRFVHGAQAVAIAPNMPGGGHPHPLHGFGWLSKWRTIEHGPTDAVLEHHHQGGEWPWPYRARQGFRLTAEGVLLELSLTNLGADAMPAGLGFHPYFPRDATTVYRGLHRGEWHTTADCLPLHLDERPAAIDWWAGQPVGSRTVDTAYTDREGPLRIEWPARALALTFEPTPNLPFTVVYTPEGADFFCVEPVSHATDAVNAHAAIASLAPGETMRAAIMLHAEAL